MTPEDRMDILDVLALYGQVLDRGMWQRLEDVFVGDATFDPSRVGLPIMRGVSEIREKLIPLEVRNPKRCRHSTNEAIVEWGPANARVLSKFISNHPTSIIAYGEYDDEMIKTAEGWRIKHRTTRLRALGRDDGNSAITDAEPEGMLDNAAAPPAPPRGRAALSLTLADRLELLELQNLYGHVLDRGLWDRIGEIFTDDGVFDPSDVGLPAMEGLEEIRAKLIPLEEAAGPERSHHSTNAVILEAASGRATMLSKYLCSAGAAVISYGEYEDDLVKTADGWRIARRKTRRRAQGIEPNAPSTIDVDWNALLGNAPTPPPLAPPRAPSPLTAEDRLDLLQLLAAYGFMFDHFRRDQLHEVFTDDGIFDPSSVGLPIVQGIDDFRRKFFAEEDRAKRKQSAHHATNGVILEATPTTAKLLSKYLVRSPAAAVAFGEYEDDVVKTADGWRLKRRKTSRRALGFADHPE